LQDALSYPPDLTGVPKQLRRWVGENAARALGVMGAHAQVALPVLTNLQTNSCQS
jgi:hypothetical protein